MCSSAQWSVDQLVAVEPRTWAGINRPGGVAKITKLHYSNGFVESLDVKYVIGGLADTKLDLDFVKVHEALERGGRSRRGRDLYSASPAKRALTEDNNKPTRRKRQKTSKANNEKHAKENIEADVSADENTNPQGKSCKGHGAARKSNEKNGAKKRPAKENSKKQTPGKAKSSTKTALKKNTKEASGHKVVLKPPPPCSNVDVSKECKVSPLADTPKELRGRKKKKEKKKKKKGKARSTSSTKPTTITPSSSARRVLCTKIAARAEQAPTDPVSTESNENVETLKKKNAVKASKVKKPAKAAKKVVFENTGTAFGEPQNGSSLPKPRNKQESSNTVQLKQIYDAQADIANDFVRELVGKPRAAPFVRQNKPPENAAASVAAAHKRRTKLFVSLLSDAFEADELKKADVLEKVNAKLVTGSPFNAEEVEDCLNELDRDGRIMISGDIVYRIV